MKIIGVLIVVFLIFILAKFYVGVSSDEKNNEVINHKRVYIESQEKLKKATETLEMEYGKYQEMEKAE